MIGRPWKIRINGKDPRGMNLAGMIIRRLCYFSAKSVRLDGALIAETGDDIQRLDGMGGPVSISWAEQDSIWSECQDGMGSLIIMLY